MSPSKAKVISGEIKVTLIKDGEKSHLLRTEASFSILYHLYSMLFSAIHGISDSYVYFV